MISAPTVPPVQGARVDEQRSKAPQTDDELHFLHCNAHFPLGPSSAHFREVLKKAEKNSTTHWDNE